MGKQSIDILVHCPTENIVFIIENKFNAKQGPNQLNDYRVKTENYFQNNYVNEHAVIGIFLTLGDEPPKDEHYLPTNYDTISKLLREAITQYKTSMSSEVLIFLNHYLDVIEEAIDMNEETQNMKDLAVKTYREHKQLLDFIYKHGSNTGFGFAAKSLIGKNDPAYTDIFKIGASECIFTYLGNKQLGLLPTNWRKALGGQDIEWEGCEDWFGEFPLSIRFMLKTNQVKPTLWLYAEVGRLSDQKLRNSLIKRIKKIQKNHSDKIGFRATTTYKYSRFLKNNSVLITDEQDHEELVGKMQKLYKKFAYVFDDIAEEIMGLHEGIQ